LTDPEVSTVAVPGGSLAVTANPIELVSIVGLMGSIQLSTGETVMVIDLSLSESFACKSFSVIVGI